MGAVRALSDQHHAGVTDQVAEHVVGRDSAGGGDGHRGDEVRGPERCVGLGRAAGRCTQQLANLGVGDLGEIPKRFTDGQKRCRHRRAHHIVDDPGELAAGRFRCGRYRDDDFGWFGLAKRLDRRQHRRSGGQAVVDEDHRLAGDVERRAVTSVGGLAANQLAGLPFGDVARLLWSDLQSPQDVVIDDQTAAAGQCAEGELLVSRNAELPHDERVQWRFERQRHLVGDRQTAAGQAQDHDVRPAAVARQQRRQYAARLAAVFEHPSRMVAVNAPGHCRPPSVRSPPASIRPRSGRGG